MALKKLKLKRRRKKKSEPLQAELPKELPPDPVQETETPPTKPKRRKLKFRKKKRTRESATPATIPEIQEESDSDSEPLELSSGTAHSFHGIPEADWRSVSPEEVRGMSIPELHGLHVDDDQKYLIVRMLASSSPVTHKRMHEILSEADENLDYADRHFKINRLRLDGTIVTLSQRVAGDYQFEIVSRV